MHASPSMSLLVVLTFVGCIGSTGCRPVANSPDELRERPSSSVPSQGVDDAEEQTDADSTQRNTDGNHAAGTYSRVHTADPQFTAQTSLTLANTTCGLTIPTDAPDMSGTWVSDRAYDSVTTNDMRCALRRAAPGVYEEHCEHRYMSDDTVLGSIRTRGFYVIGQTKVASTVNTLSVSHSPAIPGAIDPDTLAAMVGELNSAPCDTMQTIDPAIMIKAGENGIREMWTKVDDRTAL